MNLQPFVAFIRERHAIYIRRESGQPWPWTANPILQTYRFCNVYRNLDKETKLIHENWLHPHNPDLDVWFAMVVARLVNWWPTLESVGYPVPWNPKKFVAALDKRKAAGSKVFTSAYMVHADAVFAGTKAAYLAANVLTPMWEHRLVIRPQSYDTLDSFHKRLMLYRDMGSFMAAQVVADVKYAECGPLRRAKDWHTWAASGPGSRRGLNWVRGRPIDAKWTEFSWREDFAKLYAETKPLLKGLPEITGQDLQNCLCEAAKLARGYSRNKYKASNVV